MIPNSKYPNFYLLWYIDLIATLLSLCGSLWMIVSGLKIRPPRSLSLKLILSIAFSDFIYSVANLLSNFENETGKNLCAVEAVLRQCAFFLSIYFSTCTAIASYYAAFPRRRINKSRSFYLVSVVFGILSCITMVGILPRFVDDDIRVSEGPLFCWYTSSDTASKASKYLILMIFQGFPILIGLFITLLGYGLAIRTMNKLPKVLVEASGFNVYQVLWYPAILFISFVPAFLNSLVNQDNDDTPTVWIVALNLGVTHMIGFTNALLYGLQRNSLHQQQSEEEERLIETKIFDEPTYNSMIVTNNSANDELQWAYGA